jgi:hypothetical protein
MWICLYGILFSSTLRNEYQTRMLYRYWCFSVDTRRPSHYRVLWLRIEGLTKIGVWNEFLHYPRSNHFLSFLSFSLSFRSSISLLPFMHFLLAWVLSWWLHLANAMAEGNGTQFRPPTISPFLLSWRWTILVARQKMDLYSWYLPI